MASTEIDRVAAGRAGALKTLEVKRAKQLRAAETAEIVTETLGELDRQNIGPKFLKMATQLAESALAGDIAPMTALEVKQLAEAANILHKMARLEMGETTSNNATFGVQVSAEDIAARLARLQGGEPGTPSP